MDEEWTLAGTGDGSRWQSKADEGSRGMLTGRERVLRGLKYFLGMFAVVFVLVATRATIVPERDVWSFRAALAAACAVPAAGLAGLIVMAFPRRRLWHGIFAVVVALVASGLFM